MFFPEILTLSGLGATVRRRMVWVCPWGSMGGAGDLEEVPRDQYSLPPAPTPYLVTQVGFFSRKWALVLYGAGRPGAGGIGEERKAGRRR